MKKLICLIPLLAPVVARGGEPVVKLAGIQAVIDDGGTDFEGFQTYNSSKGYGVALIVHGGGKEIVAFDDDKAAITIGGTKASCHFFGGDSNFSRDHLKLRLEFEANQSAVVSPDGTIKVVGVIPVTFATGKAETRSGAFPVKPGEKVVFPADKAADVPELKVKSSGKPEYGSGAFELVLSTNRKAEEFAGIKFYTKDGKEVEAKRTSSSWMGSNSKGSGELTYAFNTPLTDMILGVETWTGREDVPIKVDLSVGLAAPKS